MGITYVLKDPLELEWSKYFKKSVEDVVEIMPIGIVKICGIYDEETFDLDIEMVDGRKFDFKSYLEAGPPVDYRKNDCIKMKEIGGDEYCIDVESYVRAREEMDLVCVILLVYLIYYTNETEIKGVKKIKT
jgi:hypothetical protein